jgi:hypothetical protein
MAFGFGENQHAYCWEQVNIHRWVLRHGRGWRVKAILLCASRRVLATVAKFLWNMVDEQWLYNHNGSCG